MLIGMLGVVPTLCMRTLPTPCIRAAPDAGAGGSQGWGGADAAAARQDAGDAGAELAARALELEAELAALDHSMMQVDRAQLALTSRWPVRCG